MSAHETTDPTNHHNAAQEAVFLGLLARVPADEREEVIRSLEDACKADEGIRTA